MEAPPLGMRRAWAPQYFFSRGGQMVSRGHRGGGVLKEGLRAASSSAIAGLGSAVIPQRGSGRSSGANRPFKLTSELEFF